MAKRGETRPYRMRYEWPGRPGADGKPIAGTETFARRAYAEDAARAQAGRVGPTGDRCRVTVTHRDQPDAVLLTLDPAAEEAADTGRARTELAEVRARRAARPDVLAARVMAAVAAGDLSGAELVERQRRAAAALLPDDDGAAADAEEERHNRSRHADDPRPHACPLCAEDAGDPFGLFDGSRTIPETIAALAALVPVDCPTCTYRAHDAADLAEHAESNHGPTEDDAAAARLLADAEERATLDPHGRGRCDTCGAACNVDTGECAAVPGHAVAVDVHDPRQLTARSYAVTWHAVAVTAAPVTTPLVVLAPELDADTARAILAGILQVERDDVTVLAVADTGRAPL